jgi:TonB family protein
LEVFVAFGKVTKELVVIMKRLTTVLIFLCILTIQSFSQEPDIAKILLIDYNEYTTCEVVEIDGQKVNPNKYSCEEISVDVDDFSEFFPLKKVFYYDGEAELTKNDIILFWDYDLKKEIDSLPFSYSKIIINEISNDTILKIQFDTKPIDLAPDEFVSDTIILTKKEKNKLLKYTTIISIRNLGLIENKNVIDNKDWKTKSLELSLDAPTFVEVMPEFEGGKSEFLKYLTEHIKYPPIDSSKNINTKLVIEFIIDETGKITMTRILRSIDTNFDKHVVEVLENMPKWKPGINEGKPVAVKMILPINIEMKE